METKKTLGKSTFSAYLEYLPQPKIISLSITVKEFYTQNFMHGMQSCERQICKNICKKQRLCL